MRRVRLAQSGGEIGVMAGLPGIACARLLRVTPRVLPTQAEAVNGAVAPCERPLCRGGPYSEVSAVVQDAMFPSEPQRSVTVYPPSP